MAEKQFQPEKPKPLDQLKKILLSDFHLSSIIKMSPETSLRIQAVVGNEKCIYLRKKYEMKNSFFDLKIMHKPE